MKQGAELSIGQPGLHSNLQTNYIGIVCLERERRQRHTERIKKKRIRKQNYQLLLFKYKHHNSSAENQQQNTLLN